MAGYFGPEQFRTAYAAFRDGSLDHSRTVPTSLDGVLFGVREDVWRRLNEALGGRVLD